MNDKPTLYICDPDKNMDCKKRHCGYRGHTGATACYTTRDHEFAAKPTQREAIDIIAKEYLGIEILDARGDDDLDFYDRSVWSIRDALLAAYRAGAYAALADTIAAKKTETTIIVTIDPGDSAEVYKKIKEKEAAAQSSIKLYCKYDYCEVNGAAECCKTCVDRNTCDDVCIDPDNYCGYETAADL